MKDELAVTGIPHLTLVDPNGIVRWEGLPFLDGEEFTPKAVSEAIQRYDETK